jgi:DNA polymerase III alpha subunit (gram-positive type)
MSLILFVDTETGGLDPQIHSLLSVAFCIWRDGTIIPSKEWYIKQPHYVVTSEALEINKIDLVKIQTSGVTPAEFIAQSGQWLLDNGISKEDFPIVLGGHNVQFDADFLEANFGVQFMESFSHRCVDTASLIRFLCDVGKLPAELMSGSSAKAMDFFKLNSESERHSAAADIKGTAELYNELIKLVK